MHSVVRTLLSILLGSTNRKKQARSTLVSLCEMLIKTEFEPIHYYFIIKGPGSKKVISGLRFSKIQYGIYPGYISMENLRP